MACLLVFWQNPHRWVAVEIRGPYVVLRTVEAGGGLDVDLFFVQTCLYHNIIEDERTSFFYLIFAEMFLNLIFVEMERFKDQLVECK